MSTFLSPPSYIPQNLPLLKQVSKFAVEVLLEYKHLGLLYPSLVIEVL